MPKKLNTCRLQRAAGLVMRFSYEGVMVMNVQRELKARVYALAFYFF